MKAKLRLPLVTVVRTRIGSTFFGKVSKANAAFTNVPRSIRIPQENVTENPKFYIAISIVPMSPSRVIRGQLTTRDCPIRGCASNASIRALGYGPKVKWFRRNLDFLPSNSNGDGSIEIARNCDRKILWGVWSATLLAHVLV
jgi:hypothetical protein